jgi:hypothetical protein
MFTFTKATGDLKKSYRKLIDSEQTPTRDHLKSPDTETDLPSFNKSQGFRTAFYGLLILNILAVTLVLTVFQFWKSPHFMGLGFSPLGESKLPMKQEDH